jgi:hypothetical protein
MKAKVAWVLKSHSAAPLLDTLQLLPLDYIGSKIKRDSVGGW